MLNFEFSLYETIFSKIKLHFYNLCMYIPIYTKIATYMVVGEEPMISRIRGFSLWGGGGVNAIKILGILSILGGENRVVGSLCVIPKVFPYMSMRVGQVRPHRTCRHGSPSVKVDAPVGFTPNFLTKNALIMMN